MSGSGGTGGAGGSGGSGDGAGGAGGSDTSSEVGGDVIVLQAGDPPISVVCDGRSIYWLGANSGKLFGASLDGKDVVELETFSPAPTILRNAAEYLYVASATQVYQWAKATMGSTRVAEEPTIGDIAADGSSYYWVTGPSVKDSDDRAVASNGKPVAIAANSDSAFWATEDSSVYRVTSGATNFTLIGKASGATSPGRIDVTGGVVILGSSTGLHLLLISGGAPVVLRPGDVSLVDVDGPSAAYALSDGSGAEQLERIDIMTSRRVHVASSKNFASIAQCGSATYWSNWLGEIRTTTR